MLSMVKYPAHSKVSTDLLRIPYPSSPPALVPPIVKGVVLSRESESPGAFELLSMKSGLNIFRKVYF